jgi:hypothetical protein
MGYQKEKRPLKAPSFTPNPTGISLADIIQGTNGQVPIARTGLATHYAALSGDVTMDLNGVTAIGARKILTSMVELSLPQYVSVTLTNAQIKNLRATPISMIAAPGANLMIDFLSAELLLIAGVNALTESAANLGFKFTNGSGVQVSDTVECTGFIDQTVNTITSARRGLDSIVAATAAANAALVLHNTGAGEFGGNVAADATMKVRVLYRVIPTN